jgi:hypothetical protein
MGKRDGRESALPKPVETMQGPPPDVSFPVLQHRPDIIAGQPVLPGELFGLRSKLSNPLAHDPGRVSNTAKPVAPRTDPEAAVSIEEQATRADTNFCQGRVVAGSAHIVSGSSGFRNPNRSIR